MAVFGERLKELRLEKQMRGEDLGKIFHVTKTAVSNWETGNRFPDEPTLIKIADFFNVTLDYLMGRVDKRQSVIHHDYVAEQPVTYAINREDYPDGLTHEQVIQLLEQLKSMGMDFTKLNKEK